MQGGGGALIKFSYYKQKVLEHFTKSKSSFSFEYSLAKLDCFQQTTVAYTCMYLLENNAKKKKHWMKCFVKCS